MASVKQYYACGMNGFQQIDQWAQGTAGTREPEEADSSAEVPLFYNYPVHVSCGTDLRQCWFTWSQIWTVSDSGQVRSCGFGKSDACADEFWSRPGDRVIVANGDSVVVMDGDSGTIISEDGTRSDLTLEVDGDSGTIISEDGTRSNLTLKMDNVKTFSATREYMMALTVDGSIYKGKLSNNKPDQKFTLPLTQLALKVTVTMVACGLEHTSLLTQNGAVFSFGKGSRGQLGHGDVSVDVVCSPRQIEALTGVRVISVASGGWHCTVVTDSGDLYVWGWNGSGQLGLPNGQASPKQWSDPRPSGSKEMKVTDLHTGSESISEKESCYSSLNVPLQQNECESICDACCGKKPVGVVLPEGHRTPLEECREDSSSKTDDSNLSCSHCISVRKDDDKFCRKNTGKRNSVKHDHMSFRTPDSFQGLPVCKNCTNLHRTIEWKHDGSGGSVDTSGIHTGASVTHRNASDLMSDPLCLENQVTCDNQCAESLTIGCESKEPQSSTKQDLDCQRLCEAYELGAPVCLRQDVSPIQIQTEPYPLDMPDEMRVKEVACGTRHTCVLFDSGHMMTTGWNRYGQLCLGDTVDRDYLQTVPHLTDSQRKVCQVQAGAWNTLIVTDQQR